ncbi:hypothetical protein AWM75_05340 [Aerococcus urinaehominis]|uniref:Uncharacterized protein n=1 Tax=Aerococcus urinaehominis TaxID=128944 RepID=A0A0X8FLD4_9LACT|nr:glucosaminidase domain-containing protein [Aerococcus urinaehominis]AMB99452.1 hypothetical protein AWM75_05340 [Aerococcus urinaehominis]SDM28459.1 Flagellum-specific peptidoglycan hydrolase FlgJ [Aerococcus urinaehominis]
MAKGRKKAKRPTRRKQTLTKKQLQQRNQALIVVGLLACLLALPLARVQLADWLNKVPGVGRVNQVKWPSQEDFIISVGEYAQSRYPKTQILPSIVTAQAILESDFGQSDLAYYYNNLFGRKAQSFDRSVSLPTQEFVDGEFITINDYFKVYHNWQDSVDDHAALMHRGVDWNPDLYQALIGERDYRLAAQALQAAGYATDPGYADKLITTIETYNLARFDP